MAVGNPGSTMCAELNRLANAGTYPARTAFLDEQGAANKYAGTTGKSLVAALNIKNGVTNPSLFKNLGAVCNALAGTTNKSPLAALTSISGAPVVYAIGDIGPAGGKIFYDAGSTLSWGRYMEAATTTTSPTWVDGGRTAGPLSSFGSSSTAIGTGLANTNLMVTQDSTAGKAHTICRSFTGGAKTDWFLPSKDELNQLFIRRATIGGFVSTYYWSSSEYGPQQLWIQYFVSGSQFENYKNNTAHARAIRYV